jgi:antitoxin VapB
LKIAGSRKPPRIQKARVFRNGRTQVVRTPAEYRFTAEEVYIDRNPESGGITLSEKPLRPSMEEVLAAVGADFVVERNLSLLVEKDIL